MDLTYHTVMSLNIMKNRVGSADHLKGIKLGNDFKNLQDEFS